MGLRLDVQEVVATRERLERLGVEIADYDLLWDEVIQIMEEHQEEWFGTMGQGTWPPLAPSTIRQKASNTKNVGPWRPPQQGPFPPDPLIRTGRLFDELTDGNQAAEIGQGRTSLGTFTKATLSWGTDDPVAEYHQDGRDGTGGKPGMPARPVIVITPELLTKIDAAMEIFLEEKVREAGL